MRVLTQWTTPAPSDWDELTPETWRLSPVGQPVHAVNVQGVIFEGYDHYAVDDLPGDGVRVTVWNDDTGPGDALAAVWDFWPLAPHPDYGGAYNTRQTVTIYTMPAIRGRFAAHRHDVVREWAAFTPPTGDLVRHGVSVSPSLHAAHQVTRSQRGYRDWVEGVPLEELDPHTGRLRDQRAAGHYAPSEHTITFYQADLARPTGVHTALIPEMSLVLSTGPTAQLGFPIPGSSSGLLFCFTASTTDPSAVEENDWPAGTYRCQLSVDTAGADLTYGLLTVGTANGHFARVDGALTTDLETWVQTQPAFTGTGLKLASAYKDPVPGGGSSEDRFECVVAVNNASVMTDEPLIINVNIPDAFADGPWTSKPVNVAVGTFVIPSTAAVSTEIEVTGLGFTPSAILTFWNGTDSLTTTHGRRHYWRGQGFAISPTARCCGCVNERDGTVGNANANRHRNDAFVCVTESTGLGNPLDGGLLDLARMTSDGFVGVVDEQFTGHAGGDRNLVVMFLAVGGPGIANVARYVWVEPSVAGAFEDVGVGFEPSIIIQQMFGCRGVDQNDERGDEQYAVGAAVRGKTAVKQFSFATMCEDSASPTRSFAYGINSECIGFWDDTEGAGNLLNFRAEFLRMIHLGFRLNVFEKTAGNVRVIDSLCINGGNWDIGTLTTRTDTNDIVVNDLGFAPKAILFFSVCRANSTADTSTNHSIHSVGLSQGPSKQMAMGTLSVNGVTNAEVSLGVDYESVYLRFATNHSVVGRMRVKSIEPTGFICQMSDADPDAAMVAYIALGLSDEKPFRADQRRFNKTKMRRQVDA